MTNWAQVAYQSAVQAGHPDPDMFVRQMNAESGLRVNGPSSSAGAQGIAQIMPATARAWGVNPNDPVAALGAAARAMTKYYKSYNGNAAYALAAYNAGPGAVAQHNGVPPFAETRAYIAKIMKGGNPTGQAPQRAQTAVQAPQTGSYNPLQVSNQANRIMNAYQDAPDIGQSKVKSLYDKVSTGLAATPSTAAPVEGAVGVGVFARRAGETGQEYIDRVIGGRFGLRHDAGNSQTTGGRHAVGSSHYSGRGSDYGNALNTPAQLNAAEAWAEKYAAELGIKQVIYGANEDAAHSNHAHFETFKSASGPKRPAGVAISPVNVPKPPTTSVRPNKNRRPVKSKRVPR